MTVRILSGATVTIFWHLLQGRTEFLLVR